MTTLEQCYGKSFIEEFFGIEKKGQFLGTAEPLSLEETKNLIEQIDVEMSKGRDYFKNCESQGNSIEEALQAFHATQMEVQQAQENYDNLNGSPWQHRLATTWYAIRTVAGVVSTGCVIVLAVTFHHGIPVILGASSVFVGYLIDPVNLHRFVGCLYIPDNFINMRTAWGKIGEAQKAEADLEEKKKALQRAQEEVERVIASFDSQDTTNGEKISSALKKELEQRSKIKSWSQIQKKVEAFRAEHSSQQL